MAIWVYKLVINPDSTPGTIEQARADLAAFVGDENITNAKIGFAPPGHSGVRSIPAFLFELNEEGEHLFFHGFVGHPGFFFYGYATAELPDDHPPRPGIWPIPPIPRIPEPENPEGPAGPFPGGKGPEVPFPTKQFLDGPIPPALHALLSAPKPTTIAELIGCAFRLIHPGEAITLDFRPNRFNVTVDASGTIVSTGFF